MARRKKPKIDTSNHGLNNHDLEMIEKVKKKISTNKVRRENGKTVKDQSKAQRGLEDFSAAQRKDLEKMRIQLHQFASEAKINNKNKKPEDKMTKESLRKGKNANQGIRGIASDRYFEQVNGLGGTFLKFCVKEYGVKNLRDIKPSMATKFVEVGVEKGHGRNEWALSTLETNIGILKKIGEICYHRPPLVDKSTGREKKQNLNNFKNFVNNNVMEIKKEAKEAVAGTTELERRTRGRRDDGTTYTIREAKIIAKHLENEFGPHGRALGQIMIEVGMRSEEIRKMRWADIEEKAKEIDLTRKNMTKNGRPRVATTVSEETVDLLMDIKTAMGITNSNEKVFGQIFPSKKSLNNAIKTACKSGKVAYLGAHAMRSVSKEFQLRELHRVKRDIVKNLGTKNGTMEYKQWLIGEIMRHVEADPSLNPLDKNGNPRFSEKKLNYWKIENLEQLKVSQNFGHARLGVLRSYGKYKKRGSKA